MSINNGKRYSYSYTASNFQEPLYYDNFENDQIIANQVTLPRNIDLTASTWKFKIRKFFVKNASANTFFCKITSNLLHTYSSGGDFQKVPQTIELFNVGNVKAGKKYSDNFMEVNLSQNMPNFYVNNNIANNIVLFWLAPLEPIPENKKSKIEAFLKIECIILFDIFTT